MLRQAMLSAVALCALIVSVCGAQESAEPTTETSPATVLLVEPGFGSYDVVMDMLASERYVMRRLGAGRAEEAERVSREGLEGADVVIVGSMRRRLEAEEVEAILGHVEAGGNLIVLVPRPRGSGDTWAGESVASVLEALGLRTLGPGEVLPYTEKRWGGAVNICVRGEVFFARHPIAAGVRDLFMYTGHAILTGDRRSGGSPATLLAVGEHNPGKPRADAAEARSPVLVGLRRGEGRVVVALDVAYRGEFEELGLNGAHFKLLANAVEYLVSGKPSAKPQGYFTRYVPGIAQRTTPIPDVLFVPVELDAWTDLQAIARAFEDNVKAQLGLEMRCRFYGARGDDAGAGGATRSLRLPQGQSAYRRDAEFYRAVLAALDEEGYPRQCDVLVVVTSWHGAPPVPGWPSFYGAHFRDPFRPDDPYGLVVFGHIARARRARGTEQPDGEELRREYTLSERDMTRVLMHEFGHYLGLPDHMVPKPWVMYGFLENSELKYGELFKRVVASIRLSRAEGLLYERHARGVSVDARLAEAFSAAAKAHKEKRYRDCIVGANWVLRALLEQR